VEEDMQNNKGFKQRLSLSVVLAVRLAASFACAAHASPIICDGGDARLCPPPFSQTAPRADRHGASPRFDPGEKGDSDTRYGDERDFERFLRDE
jgi:hypothetical protein